MLESLIQLLIEEGKLHYTADNVRVPEHVKFGDDVTFETYSTALNSLRWDLKENQRIMYAGVRSTKTAHSKFNLNCYIITPTAWPSAEPNCDPPRSFPVQKPVKE